MSGPAQFDVGAVIPLPAWRETHAYRTVAAHVATLPDAEEIAAALGMEVGA
jgi:hypothetical protein